MPYLNNDVYTPEELGISFDDVWSKGKGLVKTTRKHYKSGKEIYKTAKQIRDGKPDSDFDEGEKIYESARRSQGFLQKHGLKLAIGGGALVVLFLVMRKKG